MAGLVWFLIVYVTIPSDILVEQAVVVGNPMGADWFSRLVKLGLLAISLLVISRHRTDFFRLLPRINGFFVVFICLAALSLLWSISRSNTLGRCVSLICYVMFSAAFCLVGWHSRRFQTVIRPLLTLLLCGSLVFGLAEPTLAIEHGMGTLHNAWHGLTGQKNSFGQLAGFGTIFWLHGWLSKQVKTWAAVFFGGLSFTCLILSRSSTSLLAAVFAIFFLLLLLRSPQSLRRSIPYITTTFAVMVIAYALAILNLVPALRILLVPIVKLTGKNMTFSDRSVIWGIIKQNIDLHPILGGGFGAYWTGPVPSSPSYAFLSKMYFYPSEAHNGYLEITNDLGFIGLLVLIGFLVVYIRQSLRLMKFDKTQGALYMTLFFVQAITNLTESTWLDVDSGFVFVLMTLATIALARDLLNSEAIARWNRTVQTNRLRQGVKMPLGGRRGAAGAGRGLAGSGRTQ